MRKTLLCGAMTASSLVLVTSMPAVASADGRGDAESFAPSTQLAYGAVPVSQDDDSGDLVPDAVATVVEGAMGPFLVLVAVGGVTYAAVRTAWKKSLEEDAKDEAEDLGYGDLREEDPYDEQH